MRVKRLNFSKTCGYPLCGKPFLSNRRTAKYCCQKCNSLAWQYFNNGGNKQAVTTLENTLEGSVHNKVKSVEEEYDFKCQRPPEPGQVGKFGEVCDCSEDQMIVYLDPVSDRPTFEELWIEEELRENLRVGVGVHDLKDRFGNRLYLNGENDYNLNNKRTFLNIERNRIEEWYISSNNGAVSCIYTHKDLSFFRTNDIYEQRRLEGLESEKQHLYWLWVWKIVDPQGFMVLSCAMS